MATGLHAQNDGAHRLLLLRGASAAHPDQPATVETVGRDHSCIFFFSENPVAHSLV